MTDGIFDNLLIRMVKAKPDYLETYILNA